MRGSRLALMGTLALVVSCGVFGSDAEPNDDDPGSAPPPPDGERPPNLSGKPSGAELNESYGVFVSPSGESDGDGSRARPLKSIAEGIARARQDGLRVYVCAGEYRESIVLESGISVIGALDCFQPVWKYGVSRSKLLGPESPVVRARDINVPTVLDGFEIHAPDGTAEQASSIVLVAEGASALTVANSVLVAGNGFRGEDGANGLQLVPSGSGKGEDAKAGEANWQPAGGLAGTPWPHYPAASKGGKTTCTGAAGHDPEAGGDSGRGGVFQCKPAGGGLAWITYVHPIAGLCPHVAPISRTAAAGADGADGASATQIGVFSPAGYSPADGTAGTDGKPGKGGRGGAAAPNLDPPLTSCPTLDRIDVRHGGAAGGAGGCPGLAGTPGKGGGASVAALLFESPGLTLVDSELRAGRGGDGGAGTLGSNHSAGGAPGARIGNLPLAGAGGRGGYAGVSGSGAGGPSFAVAAQGGDPIVEGRTKLIPGMGGAGVAAQTSADGTRNLPASIEGLRADIHRL
jgi:hypothetical protein